MTQAFTYPSARGRMLFWGCNYFDWRFLIKFSRFNYNFGTHNYFVIKHRLKELFDLL